MEKRNELRTRTRVFNSGATSTRRRHAGTSFTGFGY